MELLVATRNKGKAAEFSQMLDGAQPGTFTFRSLADIQSDLEPEETGRTFGLNACLKASAYARHLNAWTLSDDSGLVVDALKGLPGVYSARLAEMNAAGQGDADNNAHLLHLMRDVPAERRTARFVCVLALADPDGRIRFTAHGALAGHVLDEPRGVNGFGYDPLFLLPSMGRTTAELTPAEKHAVSHRGQALRRLQKSIARYGGIA